MIVPADPRANYCAHADEIDAAMRRVLDSGRYILGPELGAFEKEFATYLGGGYTVGVANGTEAIEIALRALGVSPGDEVATVANTVTATVSAIQQIGAVPRFVEIDPASLLMDPAALESQLAQRSGRVKAVVPVHLYGTPAPMDAIVEVAHHHGAMVVEDCAQAHGAAWKGRKVGMWGEAAAFSFYPTKNLGALGDGGGVHTTDAELGKRMRLLRQYGWATRYVAEIPGRNSRLDELQAAILRVKLKYLDAENGVRRQLAGRYREKLGKAALGMQAVSAEAVNVYHQFVIRVREREDLRAYLAERDIQTGVLYPVPVHRQPAYSEPGLVLAHTEKACDEILSLPCFPELKMKEIDTVADEIVRWDARRSVPRA